MAIILIMEDCALQATMLADWLELDGHDTYVTHNTRDAMDRLLRPDSIDLVVTDIFGPEGSSDEDGLTFINSIRDLSDDRLKKTPIVSVSGSSLEDAISSTPDFAGKNTSDAHFIKPLNLGRLSKTIENLLASSAANTHRLD